MKVFVIDAARCVGCHNCQIGCKDEHCGNCWMPYAEEQPEIGQFWMKVEQKERGHKPHVKVSYTPRLCNHCGDAPCMRAAKDDAVYRRDDGLVIIDPVKAKGQKQIVDACPYHVIYWNEEKEIPQKCTGCAHLIDDPEQPIHTPRCMDNCHLDVIQFGEAEDFDLTGCEVLHPEYKTDPHVYYRSLPKKFIAGTVYDSETEEIVEGATVTATCAEGTVTATTDSWGDFWLKDLPDAEWRVEIEKGDKKAALEVSTLEEDKGLGDIPLA